ncbi:MAG TPA: universal stress protein [Solirubrobacteraceae bacterium]|jgi:nucleotide-binding universal stress UspA family protein|nr:universal stress protein [Solirubrobacteraceae bacterium]
MASSAKDGQRIVVGVDGSPASAAALRWAAGEAARHSARLEAVIAWRPASAALGSPAVHPPASSRTIEEREEDAEAVLEGVLGTVGDLSWDGLEVERRVMRGTPHRVLAEAATGASMLVIGGSSGRLAGKKPWSTGQHVVHDAHCPVVVVPPSGDG